MQITIEIDPVEAEMLIAMLNRTDPTGCYLGRKLVPQIVAEFKKQQAAKPVEKPT